MTTLLFLLTGLLVGYVVYTFYSSTAGEVSEHSEPDPAPKPKPKAKAKPQPQPKPKAAVKVAEPEASEPEQYRNPASGDKAAVPTNYRFAKRWIKEALVAEGLLDKIYKNNEIDGAAETKVKKALDEFKKLTKYHG